MPEVRYNLLTAQFPEIDLMGGARTGETRSSSLLKFIFVDMFPDKVYTPVLGDNASRLFQNPGEQSSNWFSRVMGNNAAAPATSSGFPTRPFTVRRARFSRRSCTLEPWA